MMIGKFSLLGLWIVCLLSVSVGYATAQDGGLKDVAGGKNDHVSLDELVTEALANNPDLLAARARWDVATHKIIPAGSLDDPKLSFVLSNYPVDSFSDSVTPMTGKEIQLSQMVPFPGKLAAKETMAEQQARWYRGIYEDARLQLVQLVKDVWCRLYFQQRAIDVTRRNMAILRDFTRLTETRYAVGTGLQQDVLKAHLEWSKLQDKLVDLEQQKTTAVAELNRLLKRPAGTPVDPPDNLPLTSVEANLPSLMELPRSKRPFFDAYQSMIDGYQAQRHLAKLDYYPDFNVFAGYRQREEIAGDPAAGSDFISAGISINLPLWRGKRRAAVAEADSALRMARSQLEDFSNRVEFTIADQYAQMEKNRSLVQLYQTGIIPQAQQSFEASLAAYQVGDTDFLNLLDSLMSLYRYQIDYHRALSDHERSVAALEAAVGQDLGGQNHKDRLNRDIQDSQD